MTALLLAPVVLSLLVLGAHFLRSDSMALVAAVLVLLLLLGVRRPWAARTIQIALALGALEWLRTLVALASERARAGEPAARLVLILGAVVLVTAGAALAFQTRRLREWYATGRNGGAAPPVVPSPPGEP